MAPLPPRLPRGWLAAVAALLLAVPTVISAQNGAPADDVAPPTISVIPGSSSYAVDSVRVTVMWSDDTELNPSTVSITLGGVEQAAILNSPFVYSGSATQATSVGTVHLNSGPNVLIARISDAAGHAGTPVQVTYTYTPPPSNTGGGGTTPPTPNYAVQVTPDGGDTLRVTTGGYWTAAAFAVTNTSNVAATFVTSGACTAVAGGTCTPTRDTLALSAGESRAVGVQFPVGNTVGAVGSVRLKVAMVGNAAVADSGWVPAKVVAPGTLAAPAQTRPMLDRGDCPVISLGGGGASECGDLRLAHTLPATRTLNRWRSPVLLYSSQHAYPSTILSTTVTNSTGAAWDSVAADVRRGGLLASGRWPGWSDANPHRIALSFAETALPASTPAVVYTDTLLVRVKSGGTWTQQPAVLMRHIVVDRRTSPFGSGWWMAGLERVTFNAGQLLWVGGDGSAAVYDSVAAGRWASAEPEGPDSIVRRQIAVFNSTQTEPGYVRILPGKGEVAFDALGRHRYTRNRLGQSTWFFYDAYSRLSQVAMPTAVAADTTRSYWFNYNSSAGTLGEVISPHVSTPGDRRTVVSAAGSAGAVRVTLILDYPNLGASVSNLVRYDYDALGRATQVTADGTETPTTFQYSASGSRVIRGSTIAMSNGRTDTLSVGVTPQDLRGLPASNGSAAAPSSSLNTQVDGPLPGTGDYVLYYQDAAGRLTTVSTPLGPTSIYRTDPRYPGLVTRTKAPNGHNVYAAYDARGHLSAQIDVNPLDDGRNATAIYTWNDSWDEISSVTSPTGITSTFGYDARGLREWQQVGADTARRTRYEYNPQGQVRRVISVSARMRGEQPETLSYDSLGTGNLIGSTSPLGIWSRSYADRIGRDTLTVAPVDTVPSSHATLLNYALTRYDMAGKVSETVSWGQSQTYYLKLDEAWRWSFEPVQYTGSTYDAAGRLIRADRRSDPDTAHVGIVSSGFEYDGFGRRTAEVAADGYRDVHYYDAAGRDTLTINRRHERIRRSYDAMGHMLTRTMPGEDATFSYHPVTGLMLGAENAAARVHRGYFSNGALKADTLEIANADSTFTPGRHRFALSYTYDLEGRRASMTLPDSVRPSSTQNRYTYGYDAVTGALGVITDPLAGSYRFSYRPDGQLDTLSLPGTTETYHYDADGRMTRRTRGIAAAATPLYDDSLRYDLRGKTVYALTRRDSTALTYDGLGHMVHSRTYDWTSTSTNVSEEEYGFDALGNTLTHRRNSWTLQNAESPALADPTVYSYTHDGTGRHVSSIYGPAAGAYMPYRIHDDVLNYWDDAGNLRMRIDTVSLSLLFGATANTATGTSGSNTSPAEGGDWHTEALPGVHGTVAIYTYRADGKLMQMTRNAGCVLRVENGIATCTTQVPEYLKQDRTETYRYDPLGRRVFIRTETPNGGTGQCDGRCNNYTQRTIWDGDHVLAEVRYPNGRGEQDAGLDSLNAAALAATQTSTPEGHPYGGPNTSKWAQTGRVLYIHGIATDQPLGLIRMDYSQNFTAPTLVIPHNNMHGAYEFASFSWDSNNCVDVWMPRDEVVQFDSLGRLVYPFAGQTTSDILQHRCMEIDFPGKYMGMTRLAQRQTVAGPIAWMGSLVQDNQDAGGLMYRRGRYYDPVSGRFTQEDPIGLAGGLNAYGFAEGDPVNYDDPSGLVVCARTPGLRRGVERAINSGPIPWDSKGCVSNSAVVPFRGRARDALQIAFAKMIDSNEVFTIQWNTDPNRVYSWTTDDGFTINIIQDNITTGDPGGVGPGGGFIYWGYRGTSCPSWPLNIFRHRTYSGSDLAGLIAHEIGHVAGKFEIGRPYNNSEHRYVFPIENAYHSRANQLLRCQ